MDNAGKPVYAGRCMFCGLGKDDEVGVLKIEGDGFESYACALGEIGNDCIIPKIYSSVHGNRSAIDKLGSELSKFRPLI